MSSVGHHSPHIVGSDSFDDPSGHSPLQRPSDGHLYQDISGGIGAFSLADAQGSPGLHGRSPSHSPAISPRISPQAMPDVSQPQFNLAPAGAYQSQLYAGLRAPQDGVFSAQGVNASTEIPSMAPPAINIDYAEPSNGKGGVFDPILKSQLDADSLTPPDRGT